MSSQDNRTIWTLIKDAPTWLAATVLFLLMSMTFLDVLSRSILNNPIESATELTRLFMAIMVFAASLVSFTTPVIRPYTIAGTTVIRNISGTMTATHRGKMPSRPLRGEPGKKCSVVKKATSNAATDIARAVIALAPPGRGPGQAPASGASPNSSTA